MQVSNRHTNCVHILYNSSAYFSTNQMPDFHIKLTIQLYHFFAEASVLIRSQKRNDKEYNETSGKKDPSQHST